MFAHLDLGVGPVLGTGDSTGRVTNICPFVVITQGGVKISWKFGKSGGESLRSTLDHVLDFVHIVNKI